MEVQGRTILSHPKFALTIERLCYQLIENHDDFTNTCFIGVQPRGTAFANRIYQRLEKLTDFSKVPKGKLDVTFYRDDFRKGGKILAASPTEMNFLVEGKDVVLIDDVLYSGRTIRAALTALSHYGRANSIELMTLVNRRFNRELPIQAEYNGITVDALDAAYIKVYWQELHGGEDKIVLYPHKI
jgi:pyrimidine operon attenuation protein / uracil phosphoribosyltransferase